MTRLAALLLAALAATSPAAADEEDEEKKRPRVDPKALEIEVMRLGDDSAPWREKACRKIGGWGVGAKSAIPDLAGRLSDDAPEVRRAAAWALSRMEKEAAGEAKRLEDALGDADAGVRANAALALEAARAEKSVRALAKALKDDDSAVRANAAAALGRMAAGDSATLAALSGALRDDHAGVRCNAAWALGMAKEEAKAAGPALVKALSDDREMVRAMAARGVGRVDPGGRAGVNGLLKLLEAAEAAREAAAKAKEPPAKDDPEDSVLRERLEKLGGARRNALWALGRLKVSSGDAKDLMDRFQEKDPNPVVRAAAKTARERLDGTALPAAMEEQSKEEPAVLNLPWRIAVAGGSVEVVFRYER